MKAIPFLFWTLVLLTAVVAARWGAMIGLVGFVLALMFGAVAISRLTPKADVGPDRPLAFETLVAERPTVVRFPRFEGAVRPRASVARGVPAARSEVHDPFLQTPPSPADSLRRSRTTG